MIQLIARLIGAAVFIGAFIAVALFVAAWVRLGWWLCTRPRRIEARGFEVITATGALPVMKQKETNHG